MHQPDYRDYRTGEFVLPWVYLHAIKDYTDMAYHLEQHPKVKAIVNFVPVLVDQLEDYAEQFATGKVRDPLLRLLLTENLDQISEADRTLILESCFRSNHAKMIEPYPSYKRLFDLFQLLGDGGQTTFSYLSGQFLADLLTWYHLAWCGESMRREHDFIIQMLTKDENFSWDDRKKLFKIIGENVAGVVPRYRLLAERGQIEISATPHFHPLAPLMLNFESARESEPSSSLPQSVAYPGGKSRVVSHLTSTLNTHKQRFGVTPHGLWPAEGAVSTALVELMAEQNVKWIASGEGVLANSLRLSGDLPEQKDYLYRPYNIKGPASSVNCFFRDDRLSDLIGFEYARWNGKDAAQHFVSQIEKIATEAPDNERPLVSIILDGENAWEYFAYNGYHFINDLYTALEAHGTIQTTTFGEYLEKREAQKKVGFSKAGVLPRLVAGSWVYGTFSTWIGSPDKNHAWDLLCMAKQSYDMVIAGGRLSVKEIAIAEKQLSSCESSDWFWWFGDYNPSGAVASFDRLYRHNLMELYRMLKLPVPANLNYPISVGGGSVESGGTMRRGS
jgi:alpha-amylase/alpha-mannosidase (GH57 family)